MRRDERGRPSVGVGASSPGHAGVCLPAPYEVEDRHTDSREKLQKRLPGGGGSQGALRVRLNLKIQDHFLARLGKAIVSPSSRADECPACVGDKRISNWFACELCWCSLPSIMFVSAQGATGSGFSEHVPVPASKDMACGARDVQVLHVEYEAMTPFTE